MKENNIGAVLKIKICRYCISNIKIQNNVLNLGTNGFILGRTTKCIFNEK